MYGLNSSTMSILSTNFIKEGETSWDYLLLTESLVAALQHPSTVDSSWVKDKNLCRFKMTGDEDSIFWIDDDGGKLCMSFPAILDMGGRYGRFEPYFSLSDCKTVSFFFGGRSSKA
jgi:hypothetical protein